MGILHKFVIKYTCIRLMVIVILNVYPLQTISNRIYTVKQSLFAYFVEIGSKCKILKLVTLLEANCTFSITLRPRFVRYNHSLIHDYSYSRCLKISKIHEANVCVPYQKVVIFIDYIDGNSSFDVKELYNILGWLY